MAAAKNSDLLDAGFLARLARLRLLARHRHAGLQQAERRSRRQGSGMEFSDHRNYTRGDDPRQVDWNAFGRLERLYVKLNEAEENLHVAILVDASLSMQWRPNGLDVTPGKFLLARQIAAALAAIGLEGEDRVTLWFLDGSTVTGSAPAHGRHSFRDTLEFLGNPPAGKNGTQLEEAVRGFTTRAQHRGLAIVISDFLNPDGFERPLSRLIGHRFEVRVIQITHPQERDPVLSGDFQITDCETQRGEKISCSPSMLNAYRQEWMHFEKSLRNFCLRHQIGISQAVAGESLETILRKFLGDQLLGR